MEHIVIRNITSNEVESAMHLALEVFMQFEEPKFFFLALGFVPLSEEQEINGIRFTPMKYTVNR